MIVSDVIVTSRKNGDCDIVVRDSAVVEVGVKNRTDASSDDASLPSRDVQISTPSRTGLFSHSASELVKVTIGGYCEDFKSIDPRIEHDGYWMECYPMRTSVKIPAQYTEEIKRKLMQHPGITSVDSTITARGTEVNEEMKRIFVDRGDIVIGGDVSGPITVEEDGAVNIEGDLCTNVSSRIVGRQGYKPSEEPIPDRTKRLPSRGPLLYDETRQMHYYPNIIEEEFTSEKPAPWLGCIVS